MARFVHKDSMNRVEEKQQAYPISAEKDIDEREGCFAIEPVLCSAVGQGVH